MRLPTACLRTSSYSSPKPSICKTLNVCLRKKRERQRKKSELLGKAGISLEVVMAAEGVSTSLLFLAAVSL